MKKVLLASSVLALSAGFASAEISFSGSAVMGVGDNGVTDNPRSILETYLTANASGETDSGLAFGFESTMAVYSTDGNVDVDDGPYIADDGTSAYISGAWGKLSMGSVGEADEMPGTFSDIGGLAGLGVDDVAEYYTGDESGGRPSHDVNYTYSGGALTAALSAHIGASGEGSGYALGLKYSFGDAYVGIGYNDDDGEATTAALQGASTTLYAGGTFGAFGVKAMYSDFNGDVAADDGDAFGLHVSYTVEALTLSAQYAEADRGALTPDYEAFGVGAAYDLGGGASVVGGVANITDGTRDDETVWEAGFSFSF